MNTAPGRPNNPSDVHPGSRLMRLLDILHRAEDLLIALLLTATMALALFQIVQRNIMGTGLIWGDILIRIMVLWLGMAGAMAATITIRALISHFIAAPFALHGEPGPAGRTPVPVPRFTRLSCAETDDALSSVPQALTQSRS